MPKRIDPSNLEEVMSNMLDKLVDTINGDREPVIPLTQIQAEAVYGCVNTAILLGLGSLYKLLPTEVLHGVFSEVGRALAHCADIDPRTEDGIDRLNALEVAGKQAILMYGMLEKALQEREQATR